MNEPSHPEKISGGARWIWPATLLLICLIGAGTLLLLARGCARTEAINSTRIEGLIASFHTRPKLVVLTAHLTTMVHREADTVTRIPWTNFDLSLGNTVVDAVYIDNRIQYFVALDAIAANDIAYDAATKTLRVRIPRPALDPELIEVQRDHDKIFMRTENGWGKLDRYSGEPVRAEIERSIREYIRTQAENDPLLRTQAEQSARLTVQDFIQKSVTPIAPGVTVVAELK